MTKELTKLTPPEHNHFHYFQLQQNKLSSRREINTIYRGDRLDRMYERLNIYYNESNIDHAEFLDRIFLLGDKSRHFYENSFLVARDNQAIRIDEATAENFNFIFDSISKITLDASFNSFNFSRVNADFTSYFRDKRKNRKNFVINAVAAPLHARLLIRNYYFTLLHQLSYAAYKKNSHLLSTSIDEKVAAKFSQQRNRGKKVIVHAWKPVRRTANYLQQYQLPRYKGAPYFDQKEISLLGGILPHFIIGLEIKDEMKFYLNPNIFLNPVNTDIFKHGLKIDQQEFHTILSKTNYLKYFETDGNYIVEEKK